MIIQIFTGWFLTRDGLMQLITVPILPTYSALPKQNWWMPLVLTDPAEVHHTECYSSATHHAILKRVFSPRRGKQRECYITFEIALLIAAIRSQKNVEECAPRLDGWTLTSALGTGILSLICTHSPSCFLSLSLSNSPSAWLPCISSFWFSSSEQVSYM